MGNRAHLRGLLPLIGLTAVFLGPELSVAASWHYLSGGQLSGVTSVGPNVWVAGQDGLLLSSSDNGLNWRRWSRFTARDLIDVEFWDSLLGLATSDSLIYRTTDGGATWDSSRVSYINGRIRFISRGTVWVMSAGHGHRSDDTGRTWVDRSNRFWNPWFLNSVTGWGAYGFASMMTTDAGATWQQGGNMPAPVAPRVFGFRNSAVGIAAYEHGGGISGYTDSWAWTGNGGSSWQLLCDGFQAMCCDIDPAGKVYGLEEQGCIVLLGGSSYRRADIGFDQRLADISAARGERVWACGAGGAVWSSQDSGVTWQAARPLSGWTGTNLSFSDSLRGWATLGSYVARTTDAGRSWVAQVPGTELRGAYSDVEAVDETTGLAAGGWSYWDMWYGWIGEFALYRTTDGGATWVTVRVAWPDSAPIASSRFGRVGRHAWHIGTRAPSGNSLRTTDGGATWRDADTVGDKGEAEPRDVSFVDSLAGWAVDGRGSVRRTTDGGDSWFVVAETLGATRLQMVSLEQGWALVDSELMRTTDGGVSWFGVAAPRPLEALSFCEPQFGAAVGGGGLILRTTNGGESWERDSSQFNSDLHGVLVLDSGHAWAIGDYGLVLGLGDWAVGVEESDSRPVKNRAAAMLSIRPNPCRDYAQIGVSTSTASGAVLQVTDAAGRLRLQKAIPPAGTRVLVDVRLLEAGVYFARIRCRDASSVCRFVVIR